MKNKILNLVKINKPIIIGIFVNLCAVAVTILIPLAVKQFIDSNSKDSVNLNWAFVIFSLLLIQSILTSIGTFIITCEGEKQIAKIRVKIKRHILKLPVKYFDEKNSGSISSRVINDATLLRNFLTIHIPQMINGLIAIIASMAILLYLDWKLAIFLFLIFPLNALLTFPIGRINRKVSKETQESLSQLIGMTSESISHIRTIKLNNAENNVITKFKQEGERLLNLSVKSNLIFAVVNPTQKLFAISLIIIVVLYGGFRVSQGTLSTGTMISFMIFLFQLIGPVNSVADFYNHYMRAQGSSEKINEILNEKTEFHFSSDKQLYKAMEQFNALHLKNVSFSYEKTKVLDNISMEFKRGQKVAIVGPTGSGKSTIINLLTRLYSVDEGKIYLNDQDAYTIEFLDWRNMFSVVSQENTILSGTIYDNLIFGLNTKPTHHQILESLKNSCLLEDVLSLPNGIDTMIGESGLNLSGGQRQRLQIARALLKDSQILILDEATSSLDSYTEKVISENLSANNTNKTIISIAHRLSTILDADKIYFLENGMIVDTGNHFELLDRLPKYKNFVEFQLIKKNKIVSLQ